MSQERLARRTLRTLLGERAATDPILVIAAIAVSLVLLVGGSFAVAGIIANGQDLNAKAELEKVAVAESSMYARDSQYLDYDSRGTAADRALETAPIGFTPGDGVHTVAATCGTEDGAAWVAASKSATGRLFYRSSAAATVHEHPATELRQGPCTVDLGSLAAALGGAGPIAEPGPEVDPLTACRNTTLTPDLSAGTNTELAAAFASGGVVQLEADLTFTNTTGGALTVGSGKSVTLDLNGHNLTATGRPAIKVPAGTSFTVIDSGTTGALTATATTGSASTGYPGIGSGYNDSAGTINIVCGTITAKGVAGGPGIGGIGGYSAISITGGIVVATGAYNGSQSSRGAAAIGGGWGTAVAAHGPITITGGVITARSTGTANQEIGGGAQAAGVWEKLSNVTIVQGTVNGFRFPALGKSAIDVATSAEIDAALGTVSAGLPGLTQPLLRLTDNISAATAINAVMDTTVDLHGHDLSVAPTTTSPAVNVPAGVRFTVTDTAGGGTLTAKGNGYNTMRPGIGHATAAGTIIIHSGTVVATGASGGPGIGGVTSYEAITINGGTVHAQGSKRSATTESAPGIGTGFGSTEAASGDITINGGTVISRTTTGGAAQEIGNGTSAASTKVHIAGGIVNGFSYPLTNPSPIAIDNAEQLTAATTTVAKKLPGLTNPLYVIGEDTSLSGTLFVAENAHIDLHGHSLTVSGSCPGISVTTGNSLTIRDTIGGGVLTATSGSAGTTPCSGIGSRSTTKVGSIIIESGTVIARAVSGGAGIGGYGFDRIEISGGTVDSTGGSGSPSKGAGIGLSTGAIADLAGPLRITGGSITATRGGSSSGPQAEDIGGGYSNATGTVSLVDVVISGALVNGVQH